MIYLAQSEDMATTLKHSDKKHVINKDTVVYTHNDETEWNWWDPVKRNNSENQ